jgi:hypothetical protein
LLIYFFTLASKKSSSIKKFRESIFHQSLSISFIDAQIVQPVANKSSIIATLSQELIESICISILFSQYSRE